MILEQEPCFTSLPPEIIQFHNPIINESDIIFSDNNGHIIIGKRSHQSSQELFDLITPVFLTPKNYGTLNFNLEESHLSIAISPEKGFIFECKYENKVLIKPQKLDVPIENFVSGESVSTSLIPGDIRILKINSENRVGVISEDHPDDPIMINLSGKDYIMPIFNGETNLYHGANEGIGIVAGSKAHFSPAFNFHQVVKSSLENNSHLAIPFIYDGIYMTVLNTGTEIVHIIRE